MFEKFASKAFGLVSVLATFIVILAACDSGGGTTNSGESSSSRTVRPGSSAYHDPEKIKEFNISVNLNDRNDVIVISAFVETKYDSLTFDSVVVKLDGKKINTSNGKGLEVYEFTENPYNIGKDYCDGESHDVCLYAYVSKDLAQSDCAFFTRNTSTCNPPSSSSEPSSSSVPAKTLSPILFGSSDTLTLNSQTGSKGVIFSTATGVDNPSDADVYWDCPGACAQAGPLKAGKSAVKIVTEFQITPTYIGSCYWYSTSDPSNCIVSRPESTSQFSLSSDEGSNQAEVGSDKYYMIRTNPSSPPYWDSGDYLMLIKGSMNVSTNNKNIKILAWKVN